MSRGLPADIQTSFSFQIFRSRDSHNDSFIKAIHHCVHSKLFMLESAYPLDSKAEKTSSGWIHHRNSLGLSVARATVRCVLSVKFGGRELCKGT